MVCINSKLKAKRAEQAQQIVSALGRQWTVEFGWGFEGEARKPREVRAGLAFRSRGQRKVRKAPGNAVNRTAD